VRDLVRAREDLRGDLMRARRRLSKLLLRHDIRYEDTSSRCGERHRCWLAKVDLAERGARLTRSEYVGAIDALDIRRQTLEATIGELIASSPRGRRTWRDCGAYAGSTPCRRSGGRSRSATLPASSTPSR
jgi:transposase